MSMLSAMGFSSPEDARSDQKDPLRDGAGKPHRGSRENANRREIFGTCKALFIFYQSYVIAKFELRSKTNRQQAPIIFNTLSWQSLVTWRRRRHSSSSSFIVVIDGDASKNPESGD